MVSAAPASSAPAPSAAAAPGDPAALRVVRLLTIGIGVSSVLLVLLQPQSLWQPAAMPGGFRWPQAVSLAVPIVVGVCAPWQGARTLRRFNAATAVASLLLVPLAATVVGTSAGGWHLPWLVTSFAPGAVAALIAWGEGVAWGLLGVVALGSQGIRWAAGEVSPAAGVNDVQGLLTAVALVALSGQLIRVARENDKVFVVVRANEERRVAAAARQDAREQTAALVHDEVLATLLLAARASTPDLQQASVRQAARATRLIRELGEREAGPPVSVDALVEDLRAVMVGVDPAAVLTRDGDAEPFLPGEAATAMAGAVRQALVNSCAHAGEGAVRRVGVEARADRVLVTVLDNGRGFHPAVLPPTRMGVAVSILGRMRAVAGGAADVDSAPGAGTCVTLTWRGSPTMELAAASISLPPPTQPPPIQSTPIQSTSSQPGSTRLTSTQQPPVRVSRGEASLAVAFGLGQAGLAGLGMWGHADAAWRAGIAFVGLMVAFGLLWGPPTSAVSRLRAMTAVVWVVGIACLAWPASYAGRLDYAELWHLTGAAMVLVLVAVRGWPRAALGGTTVMGLVVASAILWGGAYGEEAMGALARALAVGYSGTLLVLGIQRVRRVTARGEADEFERSRGRSWMLARRRELEQQAGDLEALLGRQLERIADGAPLDAEERSTCVALEGRLRDLYRSGRLARPPVVEAAMAARRRGVDVRLLDDAGHHLDDREVDRVVRWVAGHLERAVGDQFTGRILPSGRDAIASVVTDDVVEVLHASSVESGDQGTI